MNGQADSVERRFATGQYIRRASHTFAHEAKQNPEQSTRPNEIAMLLARRAKTSILLPL